MGFGEVAELLGLEECHRKADDRIVEPVRAACRPEAGQADKAGTRGRQWSIHMGRRGGVELEPVCSCWVWSWCLVHRSASPIEQRDVLRLKERIAVR